MDQHNLHAFEVGVSNDDLLEQLKSGDQRALNEVVLTYRSWLNTIAYIILRDETDAEEVVQEFFIDFWERRLYLSLRTSLKSYLFVSIKNRCLDRINKDETRKKRLQSLYIPSECVLPENKLENTQLRESLTHAIKQLPGRQAQVFLMAYTEQKTRKQIASELGIAEETVKALVASSLKTLRKLLEDFTRL